MNGYRSKKSVLNQTANKPNDFINAVQKSKKFNNSQKEVITTVSQMNNGDISLIQGPPGTGKTQTIIRIISYFFNENSENRILVCAPSNAAINEIVLRLGKQGIYDSALASNKSKENFIRFGNIDNGGEKTEENLLLLHSLHYQGFLQINDTFE